MHDGWKGLTDGYIHLFIHRCVTEKKKTVGLQKYKGILACEACVTWLCVRVCVCDIPVCDMAACDLAECNNAECDMVVCSIAV